MYYIAMAAAERGHAVSLSSQFMGEERQPVHNSCSNYGGVGTDQDCVEGYGQNSYDCAFSGTEIASE